jgi:HSP20 family protein
MPQSPQRREPFQEFEQLYEEMGRLMENAWSPGIGNGNAWVPIADIEETDDAWIVEAELPGVNRKDVNVELRNNEVVITGELKEKERKGVLRRRTRRTGRFEYRVILPTEVDAEHIDANLHDGVLTLRVPKAEQGKPHRIEVKAA